MEPEPFENEQTVFTHQQAGTLEEFHRSFEDALTSVEAELGDTHGVWIDGRDHETGERYTVTSPGDRNREIGRFAAASDDEVDRAVRAAGDAFESWRRTHWRERVDVFRAAGDLMADRKFELAATVTLENGKNRTEAMADVDEAIDFLRFYSRELERAAGYEYDTGEPTPGQHCSNSLEPFGVFGVIGPFNFPCAIFTGMTAGALLAGNTVVAKPARPTSLIAHEVVDVLSEAGVPDGVLNLVTGGGDTVGQPIVEHEAVDGIAFTGSRAVGRQIQRTFLEKDGPVIAELGGKNPVIVTASADLDRAVSGVAKGAFGYSGQKCSATARVYVHRDVFDPFTTQLVAETAQLPILPPRHEDASVSPLIDEAAADRYRTVCRTAREVGTVRTGGGVVSSPDLPDGRYVEPTVATDIPHTHDLAREEHFLPFVTVHPVSTLDEAITKANDSRYGLCAGLFSEDDTEIETWFDRIESGMCYVNRHQSATTGALVGAQPFGGWKASGTTSKFAGGSWYLPQFMREQSRTLVDET